MFIIEHFNIYEQDKFISVELSRKKSYTTSGQVSRDCSFSIFFICLFFFFFWGGGGVGKGGWFCFVFSVWL